MFLIFLENLKRLTIFIVISKTILHFGIGKKFEKYLKLILSFMVVAQLVFAIGSCFHSNRGIMEGMTIEGYYARWEEYMQVLDEEYEKGQSTLEDKMLHKKTTYEEKEEKKSIIIEKVVIP